MTFSIPRFKIRAAFNDSWSAGEDRPLSAMLGQADRAPFQAKRLGRDRIEFAPRVIVADAAE